MNYLTLLLSLTWVCFTFGEGCIQSEREALLEFKAGIEDPSSFLSSWVPQGDCCTWSGVVCDENSSTGYVTELHLGWPRRKKNSAFSGKLNPSLLELKHLSYLDLSYNDFQGIPIPSFLGSMSSLNHLYLDRAGFGGVVPHQLGNLSHLQELSLLAEHDDYVLYADSLQWISGLHSLEYLDLSSVDLSNASDWLNMINTLPSLSKLFLSYCRIRLIPPITNLNLSSLTALDLYRNEFSQTSVPSWISSLHSLTYLDLGANNFRGSFPHELQNLTSLRTLSLTSNHFNSSIPNWLYSLHNLESLNLHANKLHGVVSKDIGNLSSIVRLEMSLNYDLEFEEGIPESFKSFCRLSKLSLTGVKLNQSVSQLLDTLGQCAYNTLQVLSLRGCELFGPLTDEIGKFKALTSLILANNSISGSLPVSFGEMTSLVRVDVSTNKINGTIPESFGMLAELSYADISQNSMQGVVFPEVHLVNLSNLSSFCAFDNQLVLKAKPEWEGPSKQLVQLDLGSWYVGPGFPHWLQNLKYLNSLDLFNSGISEPVPEWFWNMSSQLYYLNLSHNQIPGKLPHVISVVSSLSLFDFSFNRLEGPLPTISSNLTFLDLSNNLLSGNLRRFLCFNPSQVKDMQFLSLQSNHLTGEIPNCWKHWQNLLAIRLGSNKFTGKIPNSIGYASSLRSLRLQNLSLTGEIPPSLGNCTRLVSIGLGQNQLEGYIPKWLGESLPDLAILSLGSNKFHGSIPWEICNLQSLQILDLSQNYLTGTLPECMGNLSAMARAANDPEGGVIRIFAGPGYSLPDTQMLVAKGQLLGYSTILNYVRSFDLSCNNLSGEIPKQITSLKALKYLNLSHNSFSGGIPEGLTEMQSLESMDLSDNQLSGPIPSSLGGLTFLSHLNLSYNNLGGRIPSSTQLQSFNSSSFTGNQELCGPPLRMNCSIRSTLPGLVDDKESSLHWLSHSVVLGFFAGFWAVIGTFALNHESRKIYFEFVDLIGEKLWILLVQSLK
ncbi:Receptor-like protein EIX2 [Linum grandiflorum]